MSELRELIKYTSVLSCAQIDRTHTQVFSPIHMCLMMLQLRHPKTHFASLEQSSYCPFVPLSLSTVSSSSGAERKIKSKLWSFQYTTWTKVQDKQREIFRYICGTHTNICSTSFKNTLSWPELSIFYGCRQSSLYV